jgi:hypothetical protein
MGEPRQSDSTGAFGWIVVIGLIVFGVWWFNYSDHAQKTRDDELMRDAAVSANAMHRAPPRTPDEARQILIDRYQQLDQRARRAEEKNGLPAGPDRMDEFDSYRK